MTDQLQGMLSIPPASQNMGNFAMFANKSKQMLSDIRARVKFQLRVAPPVGNPLQRKEQARQASPSGCLYVRLYLISVTQIVEAECNTWMRQHIAQQKARSIHDTDMPSNQ